MPGLFAFRELPALLDAIGALRTVPDVLVADGHGIAHPRRFGLASHLGVATGLPDHRGREDPTGPVRPTRRRTRRVHAAVGGRGRGRGGAAHPRRRQARVRVDRAPHRPAGGRAPGAAAVPRHPPARDDAARRPPLPRGPREIFAVDPTVEIRTRVMGGVAIIATRTDSRGIHAEDRRRADFEIVRAPRVRFPEISPRAYEHPADKGALAGLRAVPGVSEVLRAAAGLFSERGRAADGARVGDPGRRAAVPGAGHAPHRVRRHPGPPRPAPRLRRPLARGQRVRDRHGPAVHRADDGPGGGARHRGAAVRHRPRDGPRPVRPRRAAHAAHPADQPPGVDVARARSARWGCAR